MCAAEPAPRAPGDGALVAHVVIVGFHAKLGNRIEFAYPRLRGDAVLRAPDLADSLDISADPFSPGASPRPYVTGLTPPAPGGARATPPGSTGGTPSPGGGTGGGGGGGGSGGGQQRGDWGALPEEWRFLPFMALPEGVHETHSDVVFFTLGPGVHCVACFRQAEAAGSVTLSATRGRGYERGVAARGSVQKSVVLLCRAPLYGALAAHLAPAVRAYFAQADFARTDVLAALFHSLNVALAPPRPGAGLPAAPAAAPTAAPAPPDPFAGLDLRALVRRLGPHTLAVLKLVLLERRVVLYSQPVAPASNAVVALASVLPGALDATAAPGAPRLDAGAIDGAHGLPLALFGARDRAVLQPYAPLPHIAELLHTEPGDEPAGCLIATSHNVGMLLSSAAAAASRERSRSPSRASPSPARLLRPILSPERPARPPSARAPSPPPPGARTPPGAARRGGTWSDAPPGEGEPRPPPALSRSLPQLGTPGSAAPAARAEGMATPPRGGSGRLPVVDALVNLSTGKVSVAGALEPLVRVTRAERHFVRDLLTVSSNAGEEGAKSDEHVRARLRAYVRALLGSVASIPGVIGGPSLSISRGFEPCWTAAEAAAFDTKPLASFNERFVRTWLTTRNAAVWARRVSPRVAELRPPPAPEVLVDSSSEEGPQAFLAPVDELVSGFKQNVAELGRISNLFSLKAAQGISSFFRSATPEAPGPEVAITPPAAASPIPMQGLEMSASAKGGSVRPSPNRKAPPARRHSLQAQQAHLKHSGDGSPKLFSYIDPNSARK